jgi:hypothetical protein
LKKSNAHEISSISGGIILQIRYIINKPPGCQDAKPEFSRKIAAGTYTEENRI